VSGNPSLGYAIWELIQKYLDVMFKASGHNMLIFPFSSPLKHFEKEEEHVELFCEGMCDWYPYSFAA
jgi:prolyl-tRNA synthetase